MKVWRQCTCTWYPCVDVVTLIRSMGGLYQSRPEHKTLLKNNIIRVYVGIVRQLVLWDIHIKSSH